MTDDRRRALLDMTEYLQAEVSAAIIAVKMTWEMLERVRDTLKTMATVLREDGKPR